MVIMNSVPGVTMACIYMYFKERLANGFTECEFVVRVFAFPGTAGSFMDSLNVSCT